MIQPCVTNARWAWKSIGLSAGMLILCGCSNSQDQRYAVSGKVTLDGQPVQDATIIFTPKGEGLAAAASIVDGSFSLTEENGPTQGEFGVRINPKEAEMEELESDPPQPIRNSRRLRIPKVYQRDGKLTATVSDQADQSLTFELFSQER